MSGDMRHALLVTSGFLNALLERRMVVTDDKVKFRGEHAHIGTVTVEEALDLAGAALAKADATKQED